jgi:LysM repeat protein
MCPLWFAQRSVEPMRRTLAALVLAITPAFTAVAIPDAQAQQSVVVRSGETLSEIAERHGVSMSRLMQANGITNPNHVEIGQRLTIPGSGSTTGSSAGGSTAAASSQGTAPYTVQSGETLSEIAARFNTTTARLIQINGIGDPDLVMSGTRLRVPVSSQRSASASSSAPAVNRNASEHVVQPGESLSVIAERYGTSVSRLVALNQLADPELVMVGTRLQLRGTPPAPRSTPKPAAQPRPAAPVTPAATTPAAQPTSQPVAAATTAATPSAAAPVAAAPTTAAPAAVTPTPQPALTSQPAPAPAAATAAAAAATTAAAAAATAATTTAATTKAASTTAATASAARASAAASTSATAARATPTATSSAATAQAPTPAGDWRQYGPLQVDWSKIQPMGGSYVAPSLNSEGQSLYLAVNCTARKINVTTQAGQWRTWENPEKDFEHKLVKDLCQGRGS